MALKTRSLVVDDEPLARQVLARHIGALPWLELAGECGNAQDAAAHLRDHPVDVMFLDVKMPGLSGLEFLGTLPHAPPVILTTAFSEYALAGYEYAVVDYLLKPVSFERFVTAVNKLPARVESPGARQSDFVFLRADRVDHKIRFADITHLEAYGNYVNIHRKRGTILVAKTMARWEALLPAEQFARVHRSHIVALDQVERVGSRTLRVGGVEIPIGRSYRQSVRRAMAGRLRGKK